MKNTIQLLLLFSGLTLSTGCASTGYFGDRMHDAGDIFTATVGVGVGVKARIGPIQTGLLAESMITGLRGGELVRHTPTFYFPESIDFEGIAFGGESFGNAKLERHKNFVAGTHSQNRLTPFFHRLNRFSAPEAHKGFYYYSQIEVVLALGPSIRLGFNPGELLDFILGWTTIDIYSDDLERRKQKETLEHKPALVL